MAAPLKITALSGEHATDHDDSAFRREAVAALASERKAGHWLAGPGSDAADRQAIAHAYDAIVAAAELFALHAEHRHALSFDKIADSIRTE